MCEVADGALQRFGGDDSRRMSRRLLGGPNWRGVRDRRCDRAGWQYLAANEGGALFGDAIGGGRYNRNGQESERETTGDA